MWEDFYILDGLLQNTFDIQSETIHADTQGQSLPVYGLVALLGFELLPRIRNWHDLIFCRTEATTRYQHIDSLFGSHAIDWRLLEQHWPDLLRTIVLLRYLSDPALRETITAITNPIATATAALDPAHRP